MRNSTLFYRAGLLVMILLVLFLAACSGDDDESEPAATAVPETTSVPEVTEDIPVETPEATTEADTGVSAPEGPAPDPDVSQLDGIFEGATNAQLYSFDADEGAVINISMTEQSADLDPFLALLTQEGVLLAANDDGGDSGVSAALEDVVIPLDGRYLLLATSRRGIEEPRYALDTGQMPPPLEYTLRYSGVENFDLALLDTLDLTTLDLAFGTETEVSVDADRPVLFMPIAVEATDGISVITGGEPFAVDTVIYLFNEQGRRIAVVNDTEAGFYAELIDFVFAEAGNYLIMVTTRDFINLDSPFYEGGTFMLTVSQM